jgi:hypothetical protein
VIHFRVNGHQHHAESFHRAYFVTFKLLEELLAKTGRLSSQQIVDVSFTMESGQALSFLKVWEMANTLCWYGTPNWLKLNPQPARRTNVGHKSGSEMTLERGEA